MDSTFARHGFLLNLRNLNSQVGQCPTVWRLAIWKYTTKLVEGESCAVIALCIQILCIIYTFCHNMLGQYFQNPCVCSFSDTGWWFSVFMTVVLKTGSLEWRQLQHVGRWHHWKWQVSSYVMFCFLLSKKILMVRIFKPRSVFMQLHCYWSRKLLKLRVIHQCSKWTWQNMNTM